MALKKEAELGWLLSYAGFLDMAIVTGTALSISGVQKLLGSPPRSFRI